MQIVDVDPAGTGQEAALFEALQPCDHLGPGVEPVPRLVQVLFPASL